MTKNIREALLQAATTAQNYSFLALFCFFLASLLALMVLHKIYRALATPLRGVPGPWFTRFSRLWLLREVYYGTFIQTNVRLHEKYGEYPEKGHVQENVLCDDIQLIHAGPIVRLAPNEYSIDDPAAVQIIYGSKGRFTKVRLKTDMQDHISDQIPSPPGMMPAGFQANRTHSTTMISRDTLQAGERSPLPTA